jgi:exopolysaccharide biosynthesis polyprenyl glycosylphosphotransferase
MAKIKLTPRVLRRALVLLMKIGVVLFLSFLFFLVLSKFTPVLFYQRGNYFGFAFYAFLFSVIALPYDAFKIGILRLRELIFSFILTLILTNTITYAVLALISKALISPIPMLILTVTQLVIGMILYYVSNRLYYKLYPARNTVIVYSSAQWDREVAKKFKAQDKRYLIKAVLKEEAGFEKIIRALTNNNTLIIGQVSIKLRYKLVNYCYENKKRIFIMPSVDDIILHNAHVTQIGDSLMYLVKNRSLSMEQWIIKRLIDIFLSLLILLLTLPMTLVIAVIIKLTDGGPIFFRQIRYTRNKTKFNIYKFRSMIVDAEKDGAQFTTDNDERITPIGRFIRKTRIDEIPQFINVFRGEMSIVGPRAERVENHDAYVKDMPEFEYRLKVKAGITGYAQIYGKYNTSFEDKARMDIYYIENYSIANDLKLLMATIKVIFKSDATEGFDKTFIELEPNDDVEKDY